VSDAPKISPEDPESWFEAILFALNDEIDTRRSEMRRLFEAWRCSGPDVRKLVRTHPELRPYIFGTEGVTQWRAHPILLGSGIRVMVEPYADTRPTNREELIHDETRLMFMHFLMNPLRDKILGPCARKNCDRYFRRRREADTKYCSRKCAQLQAGADSADKRREEERKEKVSRAERSIQRWLKAKTNLEWKVFVHQEQPDITPKFLTRAVTNGHLHPPKKGKP